jgi:hypothetical protein
MPQQLPPVPPTPPVIPTTSDAVTFVPASERGWGKLLLALIAFLILPTVPQLRALLPVDQTMLLVLPALAACTLVGWWAGGRPMLALAFVALAAWLTMRPASPDAFYNLARGWSLVLAGAFGLVCLFGARRQLFPRSLIALTMSLALAIIMSGIGPVSLEQVNRAVGEELTHRNSQSMDGMNAIISAYPNEWNQLVAKVPQIGEMPAQLEQQLAMLARGGEALYPSLLALESLVALAIAWSMYHRLSRARLGPPLVPLKDFRFNDQLVWGLIVGLTIVFLPTLSSLSGVGRNLLVFFGAIYAVRGLGVLSWFMAPGALAITATVGFAMLWWPVLNAIAVLGFLLLGIAAFGLGLGDTWVDWRSRARSTP